MFSKQIPFDFFVVPGRSSGARLFKFRPKDRPANFRTTKKLLKKYLGKKN